MFETPAAIERAVEIATSSERLEVLVMGTNDLAKELRAALVPGRAPLQWGLARASTRPAFAGKVILDGVYNDVKDPDGFARRMRAGRGDGLRRQDPHPSRRRSSRATTRSRRPTTRSSTRGG